MVDFPRDDSRQTQPRPAQASRPWLPALLWSGVWLVSVSATVLATLSLLSPGKPEATLPEPMGLEDPILIPPQDTPTPTRYLGEDDVALEVIPESEPQRQDGPIATPFPALQSGSDQSPFPLGLLVLLTIGCGSLSLVITWILRSSSAATLAQPPRPLAPPKRLILPPTTAPRVQPMAARGQQVTMAPATSFAQKQPISPQIRPSFPTAGQPRVTILAPEELTPLDEMPLPPDDSLNLADQLDIRRHYSLSSLIRDSEQ